MKTLKDLKKSFKPKEKEIQASVLDLLWSCGFPAFAVPNRGLYDPKTKRYNRTGHDLFAGVPDIVVPVRGGRVAFIELKSEKGTVSLAQEIYHRRLKALGHLIFVARSVDEVKGFLQEHGLLA